MALPMVRKPEMQRAVGHANWGQKEKMGPYHFRKGLAFTLIWAGVGFSGCAKPSESVEVFLPKVEAKGGPSAEARKAFYCSPDKVNFTFLEKGQKKFLHTSQFRAFFDCMNYNGDYAGLQPLVHSPATPRFLEALMESMNALSGAEANQNIKERLKPWFQEHKNSGKSKIDHVLPAMAKVIKNVVFRKALPLLASVAERGVPVWRTLLPQLARFIYDPRYPNLWQDMRKLFLARTTTSKVNHLAITTRQFFHFLKKENLDPEGVRKTNALVLLEVLDELNDFGVPKRGLLSLWEDMHNKDVFTTLYQKAGGAIRGEQTLPELNGGKGASAEAIQASMQRKLDLLLNEGPNGTPILEMLAVVDDFHKPRPKFVPAIITWYNKEANRKRMHKGLADWVARRLVGEVLESLQISKYLDEYLRKTLGNKVPVQGTDAETGAATDTVCAQGGSCLVNSAEFSDFIRAAFAHSTFEPWIGKLLTVENKKKFKEQNALLLERHGGLLRDVLAIYRAEALALYARDMVEKLTDAPNGKKPLRTLITAFSRLHLLDKDAESDGMRGPTFELNGKTQVVYDHFVSSWQRAASEALGESIIVNEAFSVIGTVLEQFQAELAKPGAPTIAQNFFRATYADPTMMEKLIYEGKRLNILNKLDETVKWLQDEIGPEIFRDESDLAAFRRLVAQIPNYILYVESGMARSGNNLMRALSESDTGFLINTYVDFITRAHRKGTARRFHPVLRDFVNFMDVRERRIVEAVDEYKAGLTPEGRELEELRQVRRQSDGVDALKSVGRALFRPREGHELNWDTSLAGEILTALRGLAKPPRRAETEEWLLTLANRTVDATDAEIDAFYDFFVASRDPNKPLTGLETKTDDTLEDYTFRKNVAELLAHPEFPYVLIELDRLFKDDAVLPSLDFLAAKVDEGDIAKLLELVRKLMGIEGMRK